MKQPKSPYIYLSAGFALGAVSIAGLFNGAVNRPAYAQHAAGARVISSGSAESIATLKNLDESYTNLAEFVSPAVVEIRATTSVNRKQADGSRMPMMADSGSGFIFRPDGWIITNDHVVGDFDDVKVTLKDGREFQGKVTRAQDSDIAVIKIDAKDLPTLAFSDSSKAKPGQLVMAVGAPFGLDQTVTFGHVSAISRFQGIQDRYYPDLIQTDASINVGNSGGPLVNVNGQIVGVNTAIYSTTGGSAGIGFAIPGNQALFIAETLINKGKITRSMIGLVPENLKDFEKKERSIEAGAKVAEVTSDGPAGAAGIKKDDIITKIGTTVVRNQVDLRNAMLVYAPGTEVPVELIRGKETKTVKVKLVEFKRPKSMMPTGPEMPKGELRFPKEFEKFFKDMPEGTPMPLTPKIDEENVPAISGKPRLGVSVSKITEDMRKAFSIPATAKGVVVGEVMPGSVAERAGIQKGDVIVSFAGKPIETPMSLTDLVGKVKWNESRRLKSIRYSKNGMMMYDRDVVFVNK